MIPSEASGGGSSNRTRPQQRSKCLNCDRRKEGCTYDYTPKKTGRPRVYVLGAKAWSKSDFGLTSTEAHLLVGRPPLRPPFPFRTEAHRRLCRFCVKTQLKPCLSTHRKMIRQMSIAASHLHCAVISPANHRQRHHRPQPTEFVIPRPLCIVLTPPTTLIS